MPYPQIPFKAIVMHGQNQPSNEFDKAEGWVIMDGAASSVFVGTKFFWQYHPKIYAINEKEWSSSYGAMSRICPIRKLVSPRPTK